MQNGEPDQEDSCVATEAPKDELFRRLDVALESDEDDEQRSRLLAEIRSTIELLDEQLLLDFFERLFVIYDSRPCIPVQLFVLDCLLAACEHNSNVLPKLSERLDRLVAAEFPAVVRRTALDVFGQLYPKLVQLTADDASCKSWQKGGVWSVVHRSLESMIDSLAAASRPEDAFTVRLVAECFLANVAAVGNHKEMDSSFRKTLRRTNEVILTSLLGLLQSPSIRFANLTVSMDYLTKMGTAEPTCWQRVTSAIEKATRQWSLKLSKSQIRSLQKLNRTLLESGKRGVSRPTGSQLVAMARASADRKRPAPNDGDHLHHQRAPSGSGPDPRKQPKRNGDAAVDLTNWTPMAQYVYSRLSETCLADLVLLGATNWPDTNSDELMADYRPGSLLPWNDANKRRVCVQLAKLFTTVGAEPIDQSRLGKAGRPSTSRVAAEGLHRQYTMTVQKSQLKREQLKPTTADSVHNLLQVTPLTVVQRKLVNLRDGYMSIFGTRNDILRFVWDNPTTSFELAMLCVYRAYAADNKQSIEQQQSQTSGAAKSSSVYEDCVRELLTGLMTVENSKFSLFCRVLMQVPTLTPRIVDLMRRACFNDTLQTQCLNTFRDMIVGRPRLRRQVFSVLISFATLSSGNLSVRSMTIMEELFRYPGTKALVNSAVLEFLNYLKLPTPPEFLLPTVGQSAVDNQWNRTSTRLCLKLFGRMLKYDNRLVLMLPDVFVGASAVIKREIVLFINELMKKYNLNAEVMSDLVTAAGHREADSLLSNILRNYCNVSKLEPALLDKVMMLYERENLDPRFVTSIYPYLSKEKLESYIPRVLELPGKAMQSQVVKMVTCKSISTARPILQPADFLLRLYQMYQDCPADAERLLQVQEKLVVHERDVFSKDAVTMALQRAIDLKPMSKMLFPAMQLVCATYPQALTTVQTLLLRMIGQNVWEDHEQVREDFVRFCLTHSPGTLLHMPVDQLQAICNALPDAQVQLQRYVQSLPSDQQARIGGDYLAALCEEMIDLGPDINTPDRENSPMTDAPGDDELDSCVEVEMAADDDEC